MSLETRRGGGFEDPGAEMIDRVTRFWEEKGRVVLGVLAVIVAVIVVGIFVQRGRAEAEERAAARLAEATVYFWQGDYNQSLQIAREVAQQYASTRSGLDAHRLIGDNAFWTSDYKTAIDEYRAYLAKEKEGLLADAVRRSLAYTLETDGQFLEAAELYEKLVGAFDRESDAEFLMGAARSYLAAGRPDDAVRALERLVNEYGDTGYAARGREMLAEVRLGGGAQAAG